MALERPQNIVTFQVPEELRRALDDLAEKKGVSRSDVIRFALRKYLYDGDGENLV
jgi:metal-responsive CopG/Arc/MetJ family transcriptional regulator